MSKPKLIGNFYFKRTVNGNLIGEFSNDTTPDILSESCDLIGNSSDFVGTYNSSWRQGSKVFQLQLEISKIPKNKFKLLWREADTLKYSGVGFMVNDLLVGYYIQEN